MMRLFLKLSGLFFAFVFITSCETDFDTTANYKDITVVYGLLDQTKAEQYIKINKAFLSETDVLTYAALDDSNQYANKLEVTLEEWNSNGNFVQSFNFDTTTIYDKEPGQFYNPEQILYKWQGPEFPIGYEFITWGQTPVDTIPIWLNTNSTYKLIIKNTELNKVLTSETKLVDKFNLTKPVPFTTTILFVPDPVSSRPFTWKNSDNAGKYEINMLFHYGELKTGAADTVYKYISLMSNSVNVNQGQEEVTVYFSDDRFFTACNTLIPYDDATIENEIKDRFSSFIEVIISAADQDFALYLEVNEPSTSIVQDKPQYSNIENGLGIFSSRSNKSTLKKVHSESMTYLMSEYPYLKFKF
jgi:hypothetical protein